MTRAGEITAIANALIDELEAVVRKRTAAWEAEGVTAHDAAASLMTAGVHIAARMFAHVARNDSRGPLGFIAAAHPHIVRQILEATMEYAGHPSEVEVREVSPPGETLQ